MSEIELLVDQLERSYSGEAWHGPAVQELLDPLDASTASAATVKGVHTIWEIAAHVAVWIDVARRAIAGESMPQKLAVEQDWPPVPDASAAAWRQMMKRLDSAHSGLIRAVGEMDGSRLQEQVPGRPYNFYFLLHGIAQHNLYHAGQMAILIRAAEADAL